MEANKQIVYERFFTWYKLFWSCVYLLLAVGGKHSANYIFFLIFGKMLFPKM